MYCTPQVLRPFADTNMISDIKNNQRNCLAVGRGNFLTNKKNPTKITPPKNWRRYTNCIAGIALTPILHTTQVVPQTILVMESAMYPFALSVNANGFVLVFKMSCICNYHCQIILNTIINTILISY
jgi:hypothetical protein